MKYTRKNIYRHLKQCVSVSRRSMALCGMLSLAITAVSLISPYLYKILVDDVMTGGELTKLFWLIPAMIGVYLVKVALAACNTYVGRKFAYDTGLDVKRRLMERFLSRSIDQTLGNDVGRQSNVLEKDSAAVHAFLSGHVVGYAVSFTVAAIYMLLMLLISPWLSLVSIVLLPLSAVISERIGKKYNAVNREQYEVKSATRTHLFDTVRKWREIKSNTLEARFAAEYDSRLEPERRLNSRWMLYFSLRAFFYDIKSDFVMKVLVYFVGGLLILSDDISIGGLLMFMSYMASMSNSLDALMRSRSDLLGQKAAFERLFAVLDEPLPAAGAVCPAYPTVSLENVDFSYPPSDVKVLADVSCRFEYGKKYLIVGKSGEGKSTLIKLLLGMNRPQRGRLTLNGVDIGDIDPQSLLRNVGAVMQENMFFNLSVGDNLLLVAPDAKEGDIRAALKAAGLEAFVDSLPQGTDTVIGERGVKLSGGQKQRLAIARLILHDPQIIILDEATSALDPIAEGEILENLNVIFKGRTMIVISHKALVNFQYDLQYLVEGQKLFRKIR